MRQPESKLKEALRDGFAAACPNGWFNFQAPTFVSKRGIPDLLFVAPELNGPVWVEAKVSPNDLSKIQEHTTRLMTRGGAQVRLVSWSDTTLDEPKAKRIVWVSRVSYEHDDKRTYRKTCLFFPWTAFSDPKFWYELGGVR